MAKSPDDRYATTPEFAAAMRKALTGTADAADAAVRSDARPRDGRQRGRGRRRCAARSAAPGGGTSARAGTARAWRRRRASQEEMAPSVAIILAPDRGGIVGGILASRWRLVEHDRRLASRRRRSHRGGEGVHDDEAREARPSKPTSARRKPTLPRRSRTVSRSPSSSPDPTRSTRTTPKSRRAASHGGAATATEASGRAREPGSTPDQKFGGHRVCYVDGDGESPCVDAREEGPREPRRHARHREGAGRVTPAASSAGGRLPPARSERAGTRLRRRSAWSDQESHWH